MDRRDLLKLIALATGSALIGGDMLLSACARSPYKTTGRFSANDVALLDEIAETILPRTSTPGAKDAEVGPFMAMMVEDCYSDQDQDAFYAGLITLRDTHSFGTMDAASRTSFLEQLDREAKDYQRPEGGAPHYFTLMKQLAMLGFFTSEVGMKQALRYLPIPGRYDGNYPYKPGDRAWAI
jgi:hypothetical protein